MEGRLSEHPTIVLVHGLAILRRGDHMLAGVAEALEQRGHRVARTHVQGDGTLEALAARLWGQVERLPAPYVLLCHSTGGLEARTFLLEERKAEKIRAIATLGTPHEGTPMALPMTPFNVAYRALTTRARRRWNEANGEREQGLAARFGVRCVSAIAQIEGRARSAQLLAGQFLLDRLAGPNDGLVPGCAQRWGELAFQVDLDHLECAATAGASRPANAVDAWCRLAEAALG